MILGIGSDLVDCRRIEKVVQRFETRFINRVFTLQEQARVSRRTEQIAGYAKLFAIKEAVLKAIGTGLTGGIVWHDIEVFREAKQAPQAIVSGMALEFIKKQTPTGYKAHIHISVSDEWPYAQAFAIINLSPI